MLISEPWVKFFSSVILTINPSPRTDSNIVFVIKGFCFFAFKRFNPFTNHLIITQCWCRRIGKVDSVCSSCLGSHLPFQSQMNPDYVNWRSCRVKAQSKMWPPDTLSSSDHHRQSVISCTVSLGKPELREEYMEITEEENYCSPVRTGRQSLE